MWNVEQFGGKCSRKYRFDMKKSNVCPFAFVLKKGIVNSLVSEAEQSCREGV